MSIVDKDDQIQRLLLGEGSVRAQMVTLTRSWREILKRHDLPAVLIAELGRLSAAGVLLAAALKFEGSLVLQIHGDGPVKLMVVESSANGEFRATAKLSEGAVLQDGDSLDVLVNSEGKGRFVVTLDPGPTAENRQTYQGIVSLDAGAVALMLESYMQRSEQIPTRIWLSANRERACGLLLQKLPGDGGIHSASDNDAWDRLVLLADTVTERELLSLTPEALLHRLFWQEKIQTSETRSCRFACSCTREKVASMLRMLGRREVEEILAERADVEVHCDFCNQRYAFDAIDSAQLFTDTAPAPESDLRH